MKVIEHIRSSKIFHNLSYTLMANTINQLRGFLLVWTAVKFLSVEAYGELVLVTFLIGTVVDLSDFGVNVSTTRFTAKYYQGHDYGRFFSTIIYSLKRKLFAFVFVAIGLGIFSEKVAILIFNNAALENYVYLSIIAIFFGMNAGVINSIIQGKQAFSKMLCIAVGTICIVFLLFLALWYANELDFKGFVFLNIAVAVCSCSLGTFLIRKDIQRSWKFKYKTKEIRKEFNNFGNWMLIWSIFVIIKSKIDVLMIAQLATTEQVAYYDLANKFSKPLMLIFSSYGQVLTPMFAGIQSTEKLRFLVSQTKKSCASITGILLIGILLAPYMIEIIVGNGYMESGFLLQMIILSLVFFVWTMPFNSSLFALNKPFVFSIDTVIGMIVTLLGNYLLIPLWGAEGAAVTVIMVNIVSLITSAYFYRKFMR